MQAFYSKTHIIKPFAVVQYAGYKGCGLHKLDAKVGLHYWSGISNHCSAIWLMPHDLTFPRTTLQEAEELAEKVIHID